LNILFASAMYPPIRTGTSFYTRNLALALRQRGHRVTVATLANRDAQGEDRDPLDPIRLPALHFPVKGYFKHLRICSLYPGNFRRLAQLADEVAADAVVLVNHYLDIAFPAIYAARRRGIPLLCSVGTQLQSPHPVRHRILNVLDRLICGNIVFPACSRIIAWDDQIVRYLVDVHGERLLPKIDVVNYGVNAEERLRAVGQAPALRIKQILGVGAVIEQRDFTALVRAFAQIADEFPDLRLKVVGHVYHDRAVRLARELGVDDRVTFTGELPHEKVIEELARSEVFFSSLTGRYVGLGTATIEAMLMGVPTIVNAYAGILGRHQLEDWRHVVLLSNLSVEGIVERLRRLLSDDALRDTVGRGGQHFVAEKMSWHRVASDLESVLGAAIASNRPQGALGA
jgi:glycosyltransferase involved in cell wall biosynthesis